MSDPTDCRKRVLIFSWLLASLLIFTKDTIYLCIE